jgi:sugar phosphate isomerase/epimerase
VSPEEHLAQLPLNLLELHLSDNNGIEDQHLPLGMGGIDFDSLARGVKRVGFDGLLTIEIEPRPSLGDSGAMAKRDIIESLSYWRALPAVQHIIESS